MERCYTLAVHVKNVEQDASLTRLSQFFDMDLFTKFPLNTLKRNLCECYTTDSTIERPSNLERTY
jgi:hypothetical protein